MRLQDTHSQEFRFQTIVKLSQAGKTQSMIADTLDCSQAWVSKVLNRYKDLGAEGLRVKGKAKGAKPKLDLDQIEQLKNLLLQGALEHGFTTDNWTRERIAELIKKEFSVSYHPAHISRIMRKIGFSLQKPKTKSYRKDEQSVNKWKNEELPELKKSKK